MRVCVLAILMCVTVTAFEQQQASDPWASTYQRPPVRATVIRNATILTAAGPQIDGGSILLLDGRIAAIGATVTAPPDAAVIDAAGKWVTPGIVDTHSHLGVYAAPGIESLQDGNEMTSPNTAEIWSEHGIWPQDPQFELALAGGVTTMQILPGSANLFGGRSVTVKNVSARTAEGMKFPGAPYGLKMACGENPMRVYGGKGTAPATRMGNVAAYRKAWQSATEYRDRWRRWRDAGSDPEKRPDRNLQLETLAGVLDGQIRIQNHCYRADEMTTMIAIAKEFGFKIASFHHAVEAYKVRDVLAANDICASMWADWWGFKLEAYDGIKQNIPLVDEAGGCAIVHSDSADGIQRLNQEAAKAIRAGAEAGMTISRATAVKWLTLNPAKALGIDKLTGSLEVGKNADVVIWSGDPFSAYAHAERVFIDGAQVFDRGEASKLPRSDFQLGILVAITNARILTVSGPAIERGTVVIRGGRIAAVGAGVQAPAGARVVDAGGRTLTPGWLDSGIQTGIVEIPTSAQGTSDQNTTDARVSAAFTVVDSFNPSSTLIPVTRVEGITRALITPGGTGNVFMGQAAVVDFSGAQLPGSLTRAPAAMMAVLGEAGAAAAGGSRSTAMLRLREILQDAQDYAAHRLAFDTAQRRAYARSRLDLDALQPVLQRQVPLVIQANRASDLLAAIRLADEFKLRLVLMGAAEGWMVAPQLAERNIPVVVKPLTNIPSFDALGATLENAARLSRAGVTVALASFDTQNSRNLRQEAGNAIANGMDRDAALEAVTLTPARLWGVADRLGSIEVGKDADLVIWSGDPFELAAGAEHVFIKGVEAPKDTRQTQLLQRYRRIGQ
ncbi:MAG TPA: amidohydrolase family protein [Vicinamibacterales bacterium]|nr:amidohydrolase family protein [Vicinamibacterales bacterium]